MTRTMEIRYQDSLFMQSRTTSTTDGHVHTHLSYGPLVTGMHVADAWTDDDGKTIQASIDGRPLVPVPARVDPTTVRFADGSPLPSATIAPGVLDAVAELTDQATALARACDAPDPFGPPVAGGAGGVQLLAESYPGNPGQLDDPQSSTSCLLCKGACVAVGIGCEVAIPKGCLALGFAGPFAWVFYTACVIVGEVACAVIEVACEGVCNSGGSCCPSKCGSRCCDQNDTCLNTGSETCCPQGTFGCPVNQVGGGTVCCNNGDQCMAANSTQCCPAADQLCPPGRNTDCCDTSAGSQCLYPAPGAFAQSCTVCTNVVCNDVCCNAGDGCAAVGCCPAQSACGDVCCGNDTPICVSPTSGTCCNSAQACNGNTTCCGAGTVCVKPVDAAAAQQFCCPVTSACGTFCCTDPTASICGHDGETSIFRCCSGTYGSLCGPNHECCDAGQTCMNFPTTANPFFQTCCSPSEVCGEGAKAVCCKGVGRKCEAGKCLLLSP